MTPIHHCQQLNPVGATPGLQSLESGPNGSAREDHIVHQHHLATIQSHRQMGGFHQSGSHPLQVISVKGGIDAALGDPMAADRFQPLGQNPSQGHPPGGDSQEHQRLAFGGRFQNLGGQSVEGSP